MKNKAKIAVLVSGGGTNLQALIDAQQSGIINSGELALVVSNNSSAYALTRAQNAGIKTAVVIKKSAKIRRILKAVFWNCSVKTRST